MSITRYEPVVPYYSKSIQSIYQDEIFTKVSKNSLFCIVQICTEVSFIVLKRELAEESRQRFAGVLFVASIACSSALKMNIIL